MILLSTAYFLLCIVTDRHIHDHYVIAQSLLAYLRCQYLIIANVTIRWWVDGIETKW